MPERGRRALEHLGAVAVLALFSALVHAASFSVADPDAFYHFRHAALYREGGLFASTFPWAAFSVIGQRNADLWFGFHVLLVPFTFGARPLDGLVVASVVVTLTSLLLAYSAMRCLGLRMALGWVLLLALCSPQVLLRLAMLRPHTLSLGLSLLIFALLTPGSDSKESGARSLGLVLAGALLSWIHLALSWLAGVVVVAVALVARASGRTVAWRGSGAVAVGLVLGALCRPRPWDALWLAKVQIVDVLQAKWAGLPLLFGRELRPFHPARLPNLVPLLLCAGMALGLLLWQRRRRRDGQGQGMDVAVRASAVLAVLFAGLTAVVARRSLDVAAGFLILFVGLVVERSLTMTAGWRRRTAWAAALVALSATGLFSLRGYVEDQARGSHPLEFRDAALWLARNSKPGEIVFHLYWDQFAQLFFWNTHNRYINGMDPIFLYAYDPGLYWKAHLLTIDEAPSFTCDRPVCWAEIGEPTPRVLARDFHASYVLVKRVVSPAADAYFARSPEFGKVFDNGQEAIYRVAPDAGEGRAP